MPNCLGELREIRQSNERTGVAEIRCLRKSGLRKSGVSSSFLPGKMNRHRAKKLGRGG